MNKAKEILKLVEEWEKFTLTKDDFVKRALIFFTDQTIRIYVSFPKEKRPPATITLNKDFGDFVEKNFDTGEFKLDSGMYKVSKKSDDNRTTVGLVGDRIMPYLYAFLKQNGWGKQP